MGFASRIFFINGIKRAVFIFFTINSSSLESNGLEYGEIPNPPPKYFPLPMHISVDNPLNSKSLLVTITFTAFCVKKDAIAAC